MCRQDLFALLYLSAFHPPHRSAPATLSTFLRSAFFILATTIATPTSLLLLLLLSLNHHQSNYHRRHEDRLVVAATYFSAQCRIPRPTGGSLSARDIYQHPRWRHNLAGFSRGGPRTATRTSHPHSGLSPPVNTHSLSLVAAILSQFLPTSSSSSSSSSSFSPLSSL